LRGSQIRIRIWLPLVDGLRTGLLVAAPEVVETLDRYRFLCELCTGPGMAS